MLARCKVLAKDTPESFEKIKAGEFILTMALKTPRLFQQRYVPQVEGGEGAWKDLPIIIVIEMPRLFPMIIPAALPNKNFRGVLLPALSLRTEKKHPPPEHYSACSPENSCYFLLRICLEIWYCIENGGIVGELSVVSVSQETEREESSKIQKKFQSSFRCQIRDNVLQVRKLPLRAIFTSPKTFTPRNFSDRDHFLTGRWDCPGMFWRFCLCVCPPSHKRMGRELQKHKHMFDPRPLQG